METVGSLSTISATPSETERTEILEIDYDLHNSRTNNIE